MANLESKDIFYKKMGLVKEVYSLDGCMNTNEFVYNKPEVRFQLFKNDEEDNKVHILDKDKS